MIGRALLIWSSAIVVAVNVPTLVGKLPGVSKTEQSADVMAVSVDSARSYVLTSNEGGHFEGRFRFNGKPIQALVDTGATLVTLNESDARKLGYGGNDLHFRYEVSTANGKIKAARITLKSIDIGTVQVRNIDALVIRGRELKFPLIGMSFMKKLSSYTAEGDQMRLVK